jgi:4-amino-4-deoxy-L-arabinose transferase-like glycosyltransferase
MAILYITPLNMVPVHTTEDECRRAIIPMEMGLSGDYLRPSLNGELYLNKPPLYNWMVAASYKVFGSYDAFSLRFPVVLSILLHCVLIFFIVRRYMSDSVAGIAALAFATNWRTLTLDSMLGLLEHTLALVIYAGFIWIFIFGEKKKWLWLFLGSYFITAVGFLIKGLPSIAHQGIALLVYFIYAKKFKLLFSWQHIAGMLLFLTVCALFYVPFSMHNHIGLDAIIQKLFTESSKRYGFNDVGHFINVFIDFPIDFIKHFLPWTIFLVVLFRKGTFNRILENRFVAFNALLFVANLPVYWLASLKNPHYLYFFLPLLFTVLFYLWDKLEVKDWRRIGIEVLFGIVISLGLLAAVYAPFSNWIASIDGRFYKATIVVAGLGVVFFYFLRKKEIRLYSIVGFLLVLRLAFNWFVNPQRVEEQMKIPRIADQIQDIVKDQPLYIAGSYPAGFYDPITYSLEVKRNEILRMATDLQPGNYYLMDEINLQKFQPQVLLEFPFRFADLNLRFEGKMYLTQWFDCAYQPRRKDAIEN